MSEIITIRDCDNDTLYGFDPYQRQTRGLLRVRMVIAPARREAWIEAYSPGDHSTSQGVSAGRILEITVRPVAADGEVDGERLVSVLRDPQSGERQLLERIVAGYSEHWDGNLTRGVLTDDARAALDELSERLDQVPGTGLGFSDAASYYLNVQSVEAACRGLGITPTTTDEEIEAMLDREIAGARENSVLLDRDDLRAELIRMREQLADLEHDKAA